MSQTYQWECEKCHSQLKGASEIKPHREGTGRFRKQGPCDGALLGDIDD